MAHPHVYVTKQALALLPKARNHYNLAVSYQVH